MRKDIVVVGAVCGVLAPIIWFIFYLTAWSQSPWYEFGGHYLSDLGVGEGAWAFNTGAVIAGYLAIPFSIGLWVTLRPGWLPLIGSAVGIGTGILLMCVGIFTEDYGVLHFVVSGLFFTFAAFFQIIMAWPLIKNPKTKTVGWAVTIMMFVTVLFVGTIPPMTLLETVAVFEILVWTLVVAALMLFISTREIGRPIPASAPEKTTISS
ncbi:MAG: DUF998 domain-containing protein [Thermoplasmata archaeon]|nr:DUF998 domain-containing protein [Thermoplasmata archaeon]